MAWIDIRDHRIFRSPAATDWSPEIVRQTFILVDDFQGVPIETRKEHQCISARVLPGFRQ